MRIKKMTATFGRLERAQLQPGEGLNIITAPNESGKSTWAAFLRTMLYGISTADRDKKGYIADKNRYQPWSGLPMQGEIELTVQGQDIILRRGQKGNVPFGDFQAVYGSTEEPVAGLTGDACGEALLGVEREVFERSAFVGQWATMELTPAISLEKRISALSTTGEEGVSFSQTEAQLKEWQRRRKHNKTGEIPKLEAKLAELTEKLNDMSQTADNLSALEEECRRFRSICDMLKQELALHDQIECSARNQRYTEAKQAFDEARTRLEHGQRERQRFTLIPEREAVKKAQNELAYLNALEPMLRENRQAMEEAEQALETARKSSEDQRFTGLSGEEALVQGERDAAAVRAAQERAVRVGKRRPVFVAAGFAAAAAGGAIAYFAGMPSALIAGISAAIATAVILGGLIWVDKTSRNSGATAALLLHRYEAEAPEDISAAAQQYHSRQAEVQQAAVHLRQVHGALQDNLARQENGRTDLLTFVHTFSPEVKDMFGVSAALSRVLLAEETLAMAQARFDSAKKLMDELEAQGAQQGAQLPEGAAPVMEREQAQERLQAAQQRCAELEREIARANGEQQVMGDPAALSAQQEGLQTELNRRKTEYHALEMALTALQTANTRMQQRFSPELSRRAGEYFSRLSGGAYDTITLNREMEASVLPDGEVLPRKALLLSQGTMDQLYLAVRLAVADLCLPEEEPVPIVLDDALSNFDDVRLEQSLRFLQELGEKRQILLFTCRTREQELLAGAENVTFLNLDKQ